MNPYYFPDAPRPGSIPLRPLGVGDIISGSFAVMRRMALLVFPIAIVAGAVEALAELASQAVFLSHAEVGQSAGDLYRTYKSNKASLATSAVIGFVVTSLLTAVMSLITAEDVVGRSVTGRQLWRRLKPRLGRVLAVSAVASVIPVLGLVLIVPGVWLWGVWAVAMPALVIERVSFSDAFSRSNALVRGQFWRVFGIRSLVIVGSSVAAGVVSLPFTLTALVIDHHQLFDGAPGTTVHLPASYLILTAVGSWIGAVFAGPFQAIADTLLYVDLRIRKEGLAPALHQAAAMSRPAIK